MVSYADQEYAGGLYGEYVQARDLKYLTFRKRMRRIRSRAPGNRLVDIGCSCGYLPHMQFGQHHAFITSGPDILELKDKPEAEWPHDCKFTSVNASIK